LDTKMDKIVLYYHRYNKSSSSHIEEELDSVEALEKRLLELRDLLAGRDQSGKTQYIPAVDVRVLDINDNRTNDDIGLDESYMSIALDENSMLLFYDASRDCYLNSVGDPTNNETTEELYDFGQPCETSMKYIIPYQDALDCLKYWVTNKHIDSSTGILTDNWW